MTDFEQQMHQAHELEHHVTSTATLIKAGIVAAVIAAIVLVVAILPSEYGVDPTGLGEAMNLTQLANPQAANVEPTVQGVTGDGARKDVAEIKIPAGNGLEYKLQVAQYDKLKFNWKTDSGEIFYDFHGEPDGDTSGYFESYAADTSNQVKGTVTVPYTGSHGWYWHNESERDITITLQTEGKYEIIGVK